MKGWRKVLLSAIFVAAIVLDPGMTDVQEKALELLILASFAGNGIEHITEGVTNAVRAGARGGAVGAVRAVTVQEDANVGRAGADGGPAS